MRRFAPFVLLAAVAFWRPPAAHAQVAVAAHVGTQGLGGALVLGLTPRLNARGSFGVVPTEPGITVDDIDYTADFPTFFRVTADVYAAGPLFLSVGALFLSRSGEIGVTGEFTGTHEFGGASYSADQVGTLSGDFGLKRAMPYLGVGFGDPLARQVALTLDVGVGLGSEPTVDNLAASGPVGSDPTFQQGLEDEKATIEADMPSYLRYYPILSLALSIRLGS